MQQKREITWSRSETSQVEDIIQCAGGRVLSVSIYSHTPKRWLIAYEVPDEKKEPS